MPPAPDVWLGTEAAQWAIRVLAILRDERMLRGKEHACLQAHRDKGVIQ